MQTAQLTTHPILNTEKRTVCHLVVDGNAHRLELLSTSLPETNIPYSAKPCCRKSALWR